MQASAFVQRHPQVMQAASRAAVHDEAWDTLTELQQRCQAACNAADGTYPGLLQEALLQDDVGCWAESAAEYVHYLSGEGERRARDAKLLAHKVLRVHACGGRCHAAVLCSAVMLAETAAPLVDFDPALPLGPCASLDLDAWADIRHNAELTRELKEAEGQLV